MAFGRIEKYVFVIAPIIINECIDRGYTTLLESHEDVASIVLEKFGTLTPMELMKKSLDDNVFKTIWQDGIGKNQIIPYHIMANSQNDFDIKTLSKK